MKHLYIKAETRIRDKRGKFGSSVNHLLAGGFDHKVKYMGHRKRSTKLKKQSFKISGHQNPNSKTKRSKPCHICTEIGHYIIECKDCKSELVTHIVEKVTDLVANVNLGEIFMISSLIREISA